MNNNRRLWKVGNLRNDCLKLFAYFLHDLDEIEITYLHEK